jgi:hypothetical protein
MSIVDPSTFTLWAEMRPAVLAYAREAPSFLLDNALKKAAREFFSHSRVWRSSHGLLLTTASETRDYAYTPPSGAAVVAVQSAWIDDVELMPIEPGEDLLIEPGDTSSEPRIGARPGNVLYLSHDPAVVDVEIKGTLSFEPASDGTGIPTAAWQQWRDQFACGAASFLVTEPGKPWSAPDSYLFLRRRFLDGLHEASNSAGPTRRISLRSKPV